MLRECVCVCVIPFLLHHAAAKLSGMWAGFRAGADRQRPVLVTYYGVSVRCSASLKFSLVTRKATPILTIPAVSIGGR